MLPKKQDHAMTEFLGADMLEVLDASHAPMSQIGNNTMMAGPANKATAAISGQRERDLIKNNNPNMT